MPNRGRVTQHTIQPHVASKHANILPGYAVKEQPEISPHAPKKGPGSAVTLPNYCFQSARTGVSCDPTPMVFYCACHTFVLPYILEGQLRPYPPQRGRVTTDSKEVGSQPTPLPKNSLWQFFFLHRDDSGSLYPRTPILGNWRGRLRIPREKTKTQKFLVDFLITYYFWNTCNKSIQRERGKAIKDIYVYIHINP